MPILSTDYYWYGMDEHLPMMVDRMMMEERLDHRRLPFVGELHGDPKERKTTDVFDHDAKKTDDLHHYGPFHHLPHSTTTNCNSSNQEPSRSVHHLPILLLLLPRLHPLAVAKVTANKTPMERREENQDANLLQDPPSANLDEREVAAAVAAMVPPVEILTILVQVKVAMAVVAQGITQRIPNDS